MRKNFSVAIVGAGLAGCFSLLKLLENQYQDVALFDLGRPFAKRRRQLEGALGCLPCSDGKFYLTDIDQFDFIDGRNFRKTKNWVLKQLESVGVTKTITDTLPSSSIQKKLTEAGWDFKTNDYVQWKPEQIHNFSRYVYRTIEPHNPNLFFDTEIRSVSKNGTGFILKTPDDEFTCEKLIVAAGRTGWRWVQDIFKDLGLPYDDSVAKIGVRFEVPTNIVKEFNRSNLSMTKPGIEVLPWNWNGTIMPEDHADMVISCFRSNESRWNSEKLSFSYINHIPTESGVDLSERIAKLSYLLFNDRVSKERNKIYLTGRSQLNSIPEYSWLGNAIDEMSRIIPDFIEKGAYHIPNILCHPPRVDLSQTLQTVDPNLILAGESANLGGLLGSCLSGTLAAEGLL